MFDPLFFFNQKIISANTKSLYNGFRKIYREVVMLKFAHSTKHKIEMKKYTAVFAQALSCC